MDTSGHGGTVEVEAIGPDDERFDRWHATIAAAYAEGRQPGWWTAVQSARVYFARAKTRTRHVALVATSAGEVVGGAELALPLDVDLETMTVELGVARESRRAGVGGTLWTWVEEVARREGRTVAQAEVFVPDGGPAAEWPGVRFVEKRGLRCASVEHRFLLDLPVPGERLDALDRRSPEDEPEDDIVSWVGPCPEQRLEEWARMRTHMNQDVPMGELTVTPRRVDADRVRESDRAMAEQGWTKVRSMAVGPDGAGRGYSEMFVSSYDTRVVVQDDTFVDRTHRGRGLGMRLKVANLRQLQQTDGLLGPRRAVQTYCERDNVAMRRTNARLGFRPVDELREYEGPIG